MYIARCAQRGNEDWKALAGDNGTSRRASGWAGEKVARSGGPIRAILGKHRRASLEKLFYLLPAALLDGLFEHPA